MADAAIDVIDADNDIGTEAATSITDVGTDMATPPDVAIIGPPCLFVS